MALEISGNIELDNGLTLSSCYARTLYSVNDESSVVSIPVYYFVSKDAYESGSSGIVPKIHLPYRYSYDRNVDGLDVLEFTQIKVKEELEKLGFSVEIIGL
jgi:hypothetical protein